jgi:hypothetical protein
VYFVKRLKWKVQNELGGSIGAREEGHKKLHIMRNKQKSDNGKKLQICAKADPVLLTKNWCSFL